MWVWLLIVFHMAHIWSNQCSCDSFITFKPEKHFLTARDQEIIRRVPGAGILAGMDILQGINGDLDILILYWYRNKRVEGIRRRLWVHDIYRKRRQCGEYYHLELQVDVGMYQEYFRVSWEQVLSITDLSGAGNC